MPTIRSTARACALLICALLLAAPAAAWADALDPPALATPAADAVVKSNPVFTWAPVPRAAKYRIQISTNASFNNPYGADHYGLKATPPAELAQGTLYWRVASIDGTGELGPYSAPRTLERQAPDAPVLTGPSNDATLFFPTDSPVLSWTSVPGVKSYKIELDDDQNFIGATQYATAATSFALPAALPDNSPRYWRVQGVTNTATVTTAWSNVGDLRSFKVAWPAATKPTPLTPTDSETVDLDSVEFTWSPVAGAAKYEIQTSTAPDFTANLTTQQTGVTRYVPVNSFTQDQYYWRVRALQSNGAATGWSATSRFKREWLDAGQVARPTVSLVDSDPMVGGVQLESDQIEVSWTPVARASYYEIEISKDVNFSGNPFPTNPSYRSCRTPHTSWTPYLEGDYTGTTGFSTCAWTGTPMSSTNTRFITEPGGIYYVRVRAVDQTPSGPIRTTLWSNSARPGGSQPAAVSFDVVAPTRTTTDASLPAIPYAAPDSADTPTLRWQPVTGAVAYKVSLALDSSFNSDVVTRPVVTTNTELRLNESLLDNTAGEPYYWIVVPCSYWSETEELCGGEQQAINIPPYFDSFNKLGAAVAGTSSDATQTDTVTVRWQDQLTTSPGGGGIRWYEVEVRDAANALSEPVVKTDALSSTPIDKSYADGQHTWRVRAIDASGQPLAWSAATTIEKRSSVPVPQAPAAGDGLPVLRWTPTAFAGSYDVEVYRGVDPAFPAGNKIASASVTGRRYPVFVPTTALPADTYSWRVRQVDAYNRTGPWSTQVLPFTVGGTPPALEAPAAAGGVPVTDLLFDWADVPGAARYKFESSASAGFGTIFETQDTVVSQWAPTKGYVGGTEYFWRVSAINAEGATLATSPARSFTPQTAPLAPAVTAAVSGAGIEVKWEAPNSGGSPITGYLVRYRAAGAAEWTDVTKVADVLAAVLDALATGTKYEAQVAAQNAVGAGPFSKVVSATTATVPGAPTGLVLTPKPGGLTATWRAPAAPAGAPITGYVVRVTPAGGAPSETTPTTLTADLADLAPGVKHLVEVAAVNAVGRGAFVSAEGTPAAAAVNPPAAGCKVPKLAGKTKAAAKTALVKAKCALGKVSGPKGGKVKKQSVAAGKTGPAGMKVAVTLKKKPKK